MSPVSHGAPPGMASAGFGQPPLKLTPGVVELLSSLDPIPEGRESLRAEKSDHRDAAEERREARREREGLKPHSGFAFG